jgi:membrane protease YdiL (CAAX protease family)
MRTVVEKNALPLFFVLTFASSWTLWILSGVLGYGDGLPPLDRNWLLAQVGVFCPSLWGLVLTAIIRPDRRRNCLAALVGVFLPATILGLAVATRGVEHPEALPPALQACVVGFALLVMAAIGLPRRLVMVRRDDIGSRTAAWLAGSALGLPLLFLLAWLVIEGTSGSHTIGVFDRTAGSPFLLLAVLFGFDLVYGGALGEELGWRGFALPLLLRRSPPLGAALVLGVIWSLWHLPIDLAVGFGAERLFGVFFRLLFTLCLSIIVTWFFLRSGHGLMSALLIHATLNWLPVMEFSAYEPAMGGLFVLMFLFALLVGCGDPAMRAVPDTARGQE